MERKGDERTDTNITDVMLVGYKSADLFIIVFI